MNYTADETLEDDVIWMLDTSKFGLVKAPPEGEQIKVSLEMVDDEHGIMTFTIPAPRFVVMNLKNVGIND